MLNQEIDDGIAFRYQLYQQRAGLNGRPFELTLAEFKTLVTSDCRYCGNPAKNGSSFKHRDFFYRINGVDRINNNLGYTVDNCCSACSQCNFSKQSSDVLTWLNWIHDVAAKTKDFPGLQEATKDPLNVQKMLDRYRGLARIEGKTRK
jgi:hypothetical protein